MHRHTAAMRIAACMLAFALCAVTLPVQAFADGGYDGELTELQRKIEESGAAYDEATAKVEALEGQIAENQARIEEVEAQLPEQRAKAAAAISTAYKLQQGTPGLVELLLSSEDFNEFLSTVTYLNAVQDHNTSQTERLTELEDELQRNKAELVQKQEEADAQKDAAEKALEEAKAARAEAQRRAEEEARREAEAAAKAAAEKAAAEKAAAEKAAADKAQADKDAASKPAEQAPAPAPSAPSAPAVDWSADKGAFVAQWQPRIDAYLSGSPLAGTGRTFAEAAWDYGVDPRWSPAISYVESSRGAVCFRPYNAWGWGNASWGSWDEAIRSHVAGLARGYGSTLTYSAAKKYCPPNADHWYNSCMAQMSMI